MAHRIRECMRQGGLAPLGGEGKVVEADETYYGDIPEAKRRSTQDDGRPMSANRQRPAPATSARSSRWWNVAATCAHSMFRPLTSITLSTIVRENIARESRLHTDESSLYTSVGKEFAAHETVKHSGEGICARRRDHQHG